MDLPHINPRALLRSLLLLGLAGWAALLASLFGVLLALKVAAWPMVGLFVDGTGKLQAFGFVAPIPNGREILGFWSLPLFAALTLILGRLAISGGRAGVRTWGWQGIPGALPRP
jgi:hypothetical protein